MNVSSIPSLDFKICHSDLVFANINDFIEYYNFLKSKSITGYELVLKSRVAVTSNIASIVIPKKSAFISIQDYIILTNQFEEFKSISETYNSDNAVSYAMFNILDLIDINKVELLNNVLINCRLNTLNREDFVYKWLLYSTNTEVEQLGQDKFKSLVVDYADKFNKLDKNYSNIINSFIYNKNHKALSIVVENFDFPLNEMYLPSHEASDFLPIFQVVDAASLRVLSHHKDFDINLTMKGSTVCSNVSSNFVEFTCALCDLGFNFELLEDMPNYKVGVVNEIKNALQYIEERKALSASILVNNTPIISQYKI